MNNSIWGMKLLDVIVTGGPLMWPIVFCSILVTGFFIEKFLYFQSIKMNVENFKNQVFDLLNSNRIKDAYALCSENPSPIAKIMKAGIARFGFSKEEIKANMEDAGLYEIPKLETRLTLLSTIAHITPLLGLIGTVSGLASIFYVIQMKSTSMNVIMLNDFAGGIWQALLTTIAGLLVAVPSFMIHNYLVYRVNGIVNEMEKASTELMTLLVYLSNRKTDSEYEKT